MTAISLDRCFLTHGDGCDAYHGRWWWLHTIRCFCPCHRAEGQMTIIYSCPDCDADLADDGDPGSLWCYACQRSVPAALLDGQGFDDDH